MFFCIDFKRQQVFVEAFVAYYLGEKNGVSGKHIGIVDYISFFVFVKGYLGTDGMVLV